MYFCIYIYIQLYAYIIYAHISDLTRARVYRAIHPGNGLCAVVAKQSASATAGIDLGMFLEHGICMFALVVEMRKLYTTRRHSHSMTCCRLVILTSQ